MPNSRRLTNYLETERSSSEGEEASDSDERSMWQRKVARVGLGALALLGVIVGYVSVNARSKSEFGADTQGVIEAPEFKELLKAQSRSLLERTGASQGMQKHLDAEVEHVHKFIKNHLTPEQKETLSKARLGAEGWNDLKMLCRAVNDTRVQKIGQQVLSAVRQHPFSSPAEIGKQVQGKFTKPQIEALATEILPDHLRSALRRHWEHQKQKGSDVWRELLDPTGDVFQRLRSNETRESGALIPSSANIQRRLRDGTWEHPKLNGWELAEGITSLVFISAAELLLHLDLLIPQMKLPAWVHSILFLPAYALGAGACYVGLSFWCMYFLGALGLNALDALIVGSGIIPQSYLDR